MLVLIYNLVLWFIYHIEHPFFEQYKIDKNEPWPWYQNKEEWMVIVKKSVALVAFNNLVSIPLSLLVATIFNNWNVDLSFEIQDLPSPLRIFSTILFSMLCEDTGFHFTHKLAHTKYLYPYVHKVHHTYTETVGIAGEYFHPIDFILGAVIPGALGSLILGSNMHYVSLLAWTVFRVGEGVDGHSGYEFPWSPFRLIPFSASSSYHKFHHTHNAGNYSSFFAFWDSLLGTNTSY